MSINVQCWHWKYSLNFLSNISYEKKYIWKISKSIRPLIHYWSVSLSYFSNLYCPGAFFCLLTLHQKHYDDDILQAWRHMKEPENQSNQSTVDHMTLQKPSRLRVLCTVMNMTNIMFNCFIWAEVCQWCVTETCVNIRVTSQ